MAPRGASPGPFFLWSPAWLTQASLWGCGQAASVSSSVQLPQWHSIVPGRGGPRLAAPRPGFQETSAWLLFHLFPVSKSACIAFHWVALSPPATLAVSLLLSSLCHRAHCWSGRKTWEGPQGRGQDAGVSPRVHWWGHTRSPDNPNGCLAEPWSLQGCVSYPGSPLWKRDPPGGSSGLQVTGPLHTAV